MFLVAFRSIFTTLSVPISLRHLETARMSRAWFAMLVTAIISWRASSIFHHAHHSSTTLSGKVKLYTMAFRILFCSQILQILRQLWNPFVLRNKDYQRRRILRLCSRCWDRRQSLGSFVSTIISTNAWNCYHMDHLLLFPKMFGNQSLYQTWLPCQGITNSFYNQCTYIKGGSVSKSTNNQRHFRRT